MPNVRFDNGLSGLASDEDWEVVAEGLAFTEGPLWHPDGFLIFSDMQGGRICAVRDGKVETYRDLPGVGPNGLTFDRQMRLLCCMQDGRWLGREEAGGRIEPVASAYEGKRLNSPNDVVVRSDGWIFFSDPPYGIKDESERELPFHGVFAMTPAGELRLLVDDFDRPNGLAFSPDERTLYIADTARHHVRAFDVAADGWLSGDRVFAEMREEGRPDGLKLDQDGRVYVCAGTLQVFAADGAALGVIDCPQSPANCHWGEDGSTLFICARTSVYKTRVRALGIAPYLRHAH